MKTAFGIFLHDLKKLARNPVALVVVLGLIILPSVYAWYSIAAMWSPYSHTDGLKVAVVSEDAGVSRAELDGIDGLDSDALTGKLGDDGNLNIGDLMVEAMKQDHSLDWQFVDSAQGESGLASGEYYAEFVLPEGFSKDFMSVLTGDLERPTIDYWVNEKYNAVALEVTDAGAGVVDALVNRVFSALVADAFSTVVKDVASDILNAGSATKSAVSTGLAGAARDLGTVSDGLDDAIKSIESWHTTVDDAQKTLDSLKSTAPDLQSAIDDGEKLLADTRTTVHEVDSAYASALAEGGKELSSALSDLASDVKKVASAISDKQTDLDSELAAAQKALDESARLIAALKKLDPDSSTIAELEQQNAKLQEEVASLEQLSAAVNEAAQSASDATGKFSQEMSDVIKGMKGRNDTFNSETLPKIDTSLDAMALVMGSLDGALGSLEAQVDQAKTLLGELDGVLKRTETAIETTAESLDGVDESIRSARVDLSALAGSSAVRKVSSIADIDAKSYSSFMASPVKAEIRQVYPLNSYGAGVAPFYTNLAIWVGCFMLIAVLKLETDPELFPRAKPWQGYVGRLMLIGGMALLQGIVVTVGDLVLGVRAVGPVSLVVAGLFVAFCFANIVYALAITFKHVGKALAVVFLIVQIPGASGMYPIQLMPGFFQTLYPWLPFTYGMGAMRESIGGFYDGTYVQCLAWLFACGAVALLLALAVRPRVLNLNRLFDRKLEAADVFITEEHGFGTDVVAEHPVVDSLLETSVGRAQLLERARRFAERYSFVKRGAPIAIVALLLALGVVSTLLNFGADGKLVLLVAFIAAVVVIFCLCVAFEFVNDNVAAQLEAAGIGGVQVEDDSEGDGDGGEVRFTDVFWEVDDVGERDGGQAPAVIDEAGAEVEAEAGAEVAPAPVEAATTIAPVPAPSPDEPAPDEAAPEDEEGADA